MQDDPLLTLQRRFLSALREPLFGASRERTDLPARDGDVSTAFVATADELLTPSATLTTVERLELYHRQYWYRLLDSMADDFPALRAVLGDPGFWRLIEAYLEARPPRSFTMTHLGKGLADFVGADPAQAPLPVHAEELARLEYALCDAREAADAIPVAADALGSARLRLPPHLHLLACRTAADVVWHRVDDGHGPGHVRPPTDQPRRFVAVYRDDLVLRVERIPRGAHAILAAIADTGSLEVAMERVADAGVLPRRDAAARVSAWFATWMARGWLCAAAPR